MLFNIRPRSGRAATGVSALLALTLVFGGSTAALAVDEPETPEATVIVDAETDEDAAPATDEASPTEDESGTPEDEVPSTGEPTELTADEQFTPPEPLLLTGVAEDSGYLDIASHLSANFVDIWIYEEGSDESLRYLSLWDDEHYTVPIPADTGVILGYGTSWEDEEPTLWWPRATSRSEAEVITVAEGETHSIVLTEGSGVISGVVTDQDDEPIAEATVELYRADDQWSSLRSVSTDAQGHYSFEDLASNNYAIAVAEESPFALTTWYGGDGTEENAVPIELPEEGTFASADIAQNLGGAVTGILEAEETPLYAWSVRLEHQQTYRGHNAYPDGTTGEWTLQSLPVGTYRVTYRFDSQGHQADDIQIIAGEYTNVGTVAAPESQPQITGTVTSAETGNPISNASVNAYICYNEDDEWMAGECWVEDWAYADSDGTYQFRGLQPGAEYFIEFSADGLAPQWWQEAESLEEATAVVIPAEGEDPLVLDVALEPGVSVSGTVVDAITGEPVPYVTVRDSNTWSSASTDEEGIYELALPGAGTYRLGLSQDSSFWDIEEVTVPAEGLTDHTIFRQRGYTISGSVRAANLDIPLANIDVQIIDASQEWGSSDYVFLSGDGTFTTDELPPGEYKIEFSNWSGLYVEQWYDGAASSGQATLVSVVDADVDGIDARLGLGGVVQGTALDVDGQPIAGATVGLATAPGQATGGDLADAILGVEVTTDGNGQFSLPPVDPGQYTLYVYSGDHGTVWYSGHATHDQADVITVEAGQRTEVVDMPGIEPLEPGELALRPEETLTQDFAITRQPVSQTVETDFGGSEDGYVTFTAYASGGASIQWQELTDGDWSDLEWEDVNELYIDRADQVGERIFRAVFTRDDEQLITDEATLTILEAPEVPSVPVDLAADGIGATSATLTWAPPVSDGGASLLGYTVSLNADGAERPERVAELGAVQSFELSGLSPDTDYEVTVSARNRIGTGETSEPLAFATEGITAPGAPEITSAEAGSATEIDIVWEAPTDQGGGTITDYVVGATLNGDEIDDVAITVSGTAATIAGLQPETEYVISVAAVNEAGTGEPAQASVTTQAETISPGPGEPTEPSEPSEPTDSSEPSPTAGAPSTPDAADLNAQNQGSITVTVTESGEIVIQGLEPNTVYYVWLFSEAIPAGWHQSDEDGVVTFQVPDSVESGDHTVVVTSAEGEIVAWGSVHIPAAGAAGGSPETDDGENLGESGESGGADVAGETSPEGLAQTGSTVDAAWGAAALIMLGLVLAVAAQRNAQRRAVQAID